VEDVAFLTLHEMAKDVRETRRDLMCSSRYNLKISIHSLNSVTDELDRILEHVARLAMVLTKPVSD
jgi:hypothetical protein